MTVAELKQQVVSGDFDKIYIFMGDEVAIMKIYLKMIAEKTGSTVVRSDSVADVFSKGRQNALVKTKKIYFVMDDKEFSTNEKAWKLLKEKNPLNGDMLILYYSTVDKRLKFWKNYYIRAVQFEHLSDLILTKYIKKDINLSDKNCKDLIDICESDYSRILLEIDKIEQYQAGYGKDKEKLKPYDGCFLDLVRAGVIYRPPKDAIFDFVNAVLDRDPNLAENLLEQSYAVGEANMVLLSVLYSSFRNLLQVQTANAKDVGKQCGLNGFQIKNVKPYVGNYSVSELIHALRVIRKVEMGIKTGRISDEVSVQYVLVNVI